MEEMLLWQSSVSSWSLLLILSEDSFNYPIFIDQYLGLKWFLIGCPIRDNEESYSHWSANPSSGLYLTGIGKTPFRCFDQWEQV